MHSVGCTRGNQTHIHHCTRRPCIPLVNGIAVRVDLQGPVEMCALLYRTVSVVFDHAAPEDRLALVVSALQFEPGIVGVDGAPGEEVSNFLGAYHHIHAHRIAAAQCRMYQV